jgi:F0F1-type ATP synthase assembly protein I
MYKFVFVEFSETMPNDTPYWFTLVTLAASVIVGIVLGQWIDNQFKTAPYGTVISLLVLFTCGVFIVYRKSQSK